KFKNVIYYRIYNPDLQYIQLEEISNPDNAFVGCIYPRIKTGNYSKSDKRLQAMTSKIHIEQIERLLSKLGVKISTAGLKAKRL
ncbi:MAG: hypothetical protein KDD43_17455, partial [Bdellovibrionales bacterium]|nr:hypothetical protein [Bdellovibrionales bacterium]